jgi:hypothetical protein
MSPQEHKKYMKAYDRGQNDANNGNSYEIAHEQSNMEKQGYSDGFASVPYNHG